MVALIQAMEHLDTTTLRARTRVASSKGIRTQELEMLGREQEEVYRGFLRIWSGSLNQVVNRGVNQAVDPVVHHLGNQEARLQAGLWMAYHRCLG